MNHCFKCGSHLAQTRSLSPTTQRFRCDKCKRGYLLSHTGNCVFFSKTLPKDEPAPPKVDETTPDGEFDFGFESEIDLGF